MAAVELCDWLGSTQRPANVALLHLGPALPGGSIMATLAAAVASALAISGQPSEESRAIIGHLSNAVNGRCLGYGILHRGSGSGMVFAEQALEHHAAGGGADGVAEAVVLGKGLDLVEVVLQIEVVPAVSIADGDVERNMQRAQFEQSLETEGYGIGVPLRNSGDRLR